MGVDGCGRGLCVGMVVGVGAGAGVGVGVGRRAWAVMGAVWAGVGGVWLGAVGLGWVWVSACG